MMFTVAKSVFQTIKKKKRFRNRPYSFVYIRRAGYAFLDDFIDALVASGLLVTTVDMADGMTKEAFFECLLASVVQANPDFVLTFSHNGVDEEGDLVAILDELRIPLVSWFLDNPIFILSRSDYVVSKNTVLMLSDRSLVDAVRSYGYAHVYYLPLAARATEKYKVRSAQDAALGVGSLEAFFVGDSFLSKVVECMRQTKKRNPLLGRYKKLAAMLLQDTERSLGNVLRDDPASRQLFDSIAIPCVRTRVVMLIYLYATTILRAKYLQCLLSRRHLVIGPDNWRHFVRDERFCLAEAIYDFQTIRALFRTAKVTLNVTSVLTNGAANERIFDVPMSGGFLLTDSSVQVAQLLEPGKEVIMYDDAGHLEELLKRYCVDTFARDRVRRNAVKRIASEHTYMHRGAALLEIVKSAAMMP